MIRLVRLSQSEPQVERVSHTFRHHLVKCQGFGLALSNCWDFSFVCSGGKAGADDEGTQYIKETVVLLHRESVREAPV